LNYFAYLLTALAAFLTLLFSGFIFHLHDSDAAGNGLAAFYTAVDLLILWIVLAVLLLVCAAREGFPGYSGWLMIPLYLFGAAAEFAAMTLVAEDANVEHKLALQLAAVAIPTLVLLRALWIVVPPLRTLGPSSVVTWSIAIPLLAASLVPWPQFIRYTAERQRSIEEAHSRDATFEADQAKQKEADNAEALAVIAAMPNTKHLPDLLRYTFGYPDNVRDAARAKLATLVVRQEESEELLQDGNENLFLQIPYMDLKPTEALCSGGRKTIAGRLQNFQPQQHDDTLSPDIAWSIEKYLPSMTWLLEHGCDCTPEIAQIEAATMKFADTPERAAFLTKLADLKKNLRK
jgi:hypothetical protein